MSSSQSDIKTCGRCGHRWTSYTENPVRCPGCGTYHWNEVPTTYVCAVCGHKWFSRTSNIPVRCPHCKTRSWRGATNAPASGSVRRAEASYESEDLLNRYRNGEGCVALAISTGISLERIIEIIRADTDDGLRLRM